MNSRATFAPIFPAPIIPILIYFSLLKWPFLRSIRRSGLTNFSLWGPGNNNSLNAKRFNDQLGGSAARILLLTRYQTPVSHGKWLELSTDQKICAQFASLVLDAERHDLLSDVVISKIFLDVGETGHRFALNQVRIIRELRFEQGGYAVAKHGGRFFRLVKTSDK